MLFFVAFSMGGALEHDLFLDIFHPVDVKTFLEGFSLINISFLNIISLSLSTGYASQALKGHCN